MTLTWIVIASRGKDLPTSHRIVRDTKEIEPPYVLLTHFLSTLSFSTGGKTKRSDVRPTDESIHVLECTPEPSSIVQRVDELEMRAEGEV